MREGSIDIAVHSLKDMPTDLPEGLTLGAITKRETPCDALVSPKYKTLDQLPQGAKVGTSSLRRQAQLLHHRPDLQINVLRGNVQTRLRNWKKKTLMPSCWLRPVLNVWASPIKSLKFLQPMN